mgnify:CR=1 FL=1
MIKRVLISLNRILKQFDRKCFNGRIFHRRDRLAISIADHYPSLEYAFLREGEAYESPQCEVKFSIITEIAPKDLVLLQYNNPFCNSIHGRFDIVKKFHELWGASYKKISEQEYVININQNGLLLDGIELVIEGLLNNTEKLKVRTNYIAAIPIQPNLFNGEPILYNNSLSSEEIKLYEEEQRVMLQLCNSSFYFFIWPPAMKYKNEIISELKTFEGLEIGEQYNYSLSKSELSELIDEAYSGAIKSADIIREKKRIIIEACDLDKYEEYPICVIKAAVPNPYYHFHARTGCLISQLLDEIKRNLRTKWAPMITNYSYDNIIHSTDNHLQNQNIATWVKNNSHRMS